MNESPNEADRSALNETGKKAMQLWGAERYVEAEPLFRSVAPHIDPTHYNAPQFLACFGSTLEHVGKLDEAERMLRSAVAASRFPVDGKLEDALLQEYGLAEFLFRRNRFSDALETIRPLLETSSSYRLMALWLAAQIYYQQQAIPDFRFASEQIYLASPRGMYSSVNAVMAKVVAHAC